MKPKSINTIMVAALLAPGALFAQTTAKTGPVGYETIALEAGFNYIGLRLHQPTLAAGVLDAVSSGSVTDNDVNIGALVSSGKTYIVEVKTTSPADSGAVAQVLGSDIAAGVITTSNNLVAVGAAVGDTYIVRESDTLASVFGATNSAALAPGYSGPANADLVYVPDGAGGLTPYFYDADDVTWKNADTSTPVDAATINLVYLDGIVIFANAALDLVVDGEVKKSNVIQVALSGFNYLSTIYPAGSTLSSAFTGALSTIHPGYSGPANADLIYVPGTGGSLTPYFYDADDVTWKDGDANAPVDATTVSLPSGVIYFNAGANIDVKNSAPSYYASL